MIILEEKSENARRVIIGDSDDGSMEGQFVEYESDRFQPFDNPCHHLLNLRRQEIYIDAA